MSKFIIKKIDRENEKDYKLWKNGLKVFDGATIFHNPDFLAYHDDRFNEHNLGIYKGKTLFGVMPMAFFKDEGKKIAKSPYGASYGGAVFLTTLSYNESISIVEAIIEYLKTFKINELWITPSLDIFYENYSDTYIFAMLEYGFTRVNSDITHIVELYKESDYNKILQKNTRNKLKLSLNNNLEIVQNALIDDFWLLMDKTFDKHGVKPTHTISEYKKINEIFKKSFYCDVVYFDGKPIAGIGYVLINKTVKMSFYHVQDEDYKNMNGLILLIANALKESIKEKIQYYDFGTSSVGMKARPNIFKFKEGFGSLGKFRHTYKLDLNYNNLNHKFVKV